jgi:hypothetical protein
VTVELLLFLSQAVLVGKLATWYTTPGIDMRHTPSTMTLRDGQRLARVVFRINAQASGQNSKGTASRYVVCSYQEKEAFSLE